MRLSLLHLLLMFAMAALVAAPLRADDGVELFEKRIRPVLAQHCYECHSANSKKLGGGLLLDSREGVRKGGDSGSVVDAAKPEESLLLKAIRYTDDSVQMPPQGKLPAAVIADFETWIRQGAPDPRDQAAPAPVADAWEETLRERATWWSMQPLRQPEVPRPRDASWSRAAVDRFLLSKLEQQNLAPAQPADPRTLARRLSLVLTGLPLAPERVAEFVAACAAQNALPDQPLPQEAVAKLVDALLASPHFGERWARHWLDVVRFSETHGNEWNYEVHYAWRYRDYLIRAFNEDVPYDQFVREHIAGDLLPRPRWNAQERFNESVIGTGFYRFGEVNHDDCISLRSIGYDLADNQIDTLTKAFQATTVACARCHNHKLDAVSTADYYGLLGVVRSSRQVSHCIDGPEVNASLLERLGLLKNQLRQELAAAWQQETQQMPRYMQAAQARRAQQANADMLAQGLDPARLEKWVAVLAMEKLPLENPFEPWRVLASGTLADPSMFPTQWRALADRWAREDGQSREFNQTEFENFADFRTGSVGAWQVGGQGLREPCSRSGEFVVPPEGDAAVRGILPAGCFTHRLSDKLNGTLRSPVLPLGKKNISFQIMGQRSSAVRLVSNNCQLNYKNYRALTSGDLAWVTFSPPDDRDTLRTYAELMTMFDNPKFPDQLSALGGDPGNYKLPWEKAAENPRSYFGVTRVVLHDTAEPPKPELAHLLPLLAGEAPASLAAVTDHYGALVADAVRFWSSGTVTDEEVRWLDALLRHGLLSNSASTSPRIASLVQQYRQLESELALPRVSVGLGDGGPGFEQPILIRGDCQRPGEPISRRYLEALSGTPRPFVTAGSGRLELAHQIASAENPLTARVMVNRVWHHLFGTGLVRTVDDFGHVGDLPSHHELLDYLASGFVEDGWSVKRLIRSLVLTRAFQMSSQPSEASHEIDPLNRLLQHYPARRMEAEAVRDSILATSGRLDAALFGPSVQPFREKEYADRRLFPGPLDGGGRRSLYIKNNLMEGPKFLVAFNLPGGKVTQGRRDVTNVPAQALALLNDPMVLEQADVWSRQLIAQADETVAMRIDAMFERALGRPPSTDERQRFEGVVQRLGELHQVSAAELLKSQPVWKDVAHTLFNVSEFIYIP